MAKYLEAFRHDNTQHATYPTEKTEKLETSVFSGIYLAHFKNSSIRNTVEELIQEAIQGIPVSITEILASDLFCEEDLEDIKNGMYSPGALRLYVGSWLLNGRKHPCPFYRDYARQLNVADMHL